MPFWYLFDHLHPVSPSLILVFSIDKRGVVMGCHGDYLLSSGDSIGAATKYSESNRSFEEISLKFVDAQLRKPLKFYLRKRLESTDPNVKPNVFSIMDSHCHF